MRRIKSLWVFHLNTGACNGCDIEVLDVLTPYYDAERLGVKLVGTPRHAHALLVTGPLTRQCYYAARKAYEAMPEKPRIVIAIGTCACSGGIFYDSYSIYRKDPEEVIPRSGGIDQMIPVDVYIPGCPPRPEEILFGIAIAIGIAEKRISEKISLAEGYKPVDGAIPERVRLNLRNRVRRAIGYFDGERALKEFIKIYKSTLCSDSPEVQLKKMVIEYCRREDIDPRLRYGVQIAYREFIKCLEEFKRKSPSRRWLE